ncbi:MAG TPA: ABC transporter permease [Bryobacteraceae bacterium]|nr:ABC transporter permease [Bryobacteraceae bacterium]
MKATRSRASFGEAVSVAFDSLRSSKLRSFLTLLGIILSTTTLISVMSVIHGMDVFIAQTASSMGNDGFRVLRVAFVGRRDPKQFLEALRRNPELSRDEYAFVREHATLLHEAGIFAQRGVKVTYSGDLVDGVSLMGTTAATLAMSNTQVDIGRMFTDTEDEKRMSVVFLGADFKDRFFPTVDPVGKIVQIDGRPYEVLGVAKAKGSVFGQSQDNYVAIPDQTYFKTYGALKGISYNFQALDRLRLEDAEDEVRMLIRSFRHLRPQQNDTFAIMSSDTLVSAWDQMTGAIAAAAVGIVSVFMVVGGVVIMNIMLAVVSERTREIGVRKSVGARRQDILNQFLVESSMLAGIGGLIGVSIAWIIAVIVRTYTAVPMVLPINAVILGVTLSAAVGLFFGIYPARRASRLDPIVALRAEAS